MHHVELTVSVGLPTWLYRFLRAIHHTLIPMVMERGRVVNLLGDRDVEWSWVAAHLPSRQGEALDVGPGGSCLGLLAAQRGFNVMAVDREAVRWPYVHPRLQFAQGDILKLPLPERHYDLAILCSTVEHIGLEGRYGVAESSSDGDLKAMARLLSLLKPRGLALLTVPVGRDCVFAPQCRVYGEDRLPRLLEGFAIEEESFWVKDRENRWVACHRDTALSFEAMARAANPLRNRYALGCFVLRRPLLEVSQ